MSAHRLITRIGMGLLVGALVACCALLVVEQRHIIRRLCTQVETVDSRIREVVQAGLDSLGQPGSAGYSYYVSHPAELANARVQGRRELFTFRAHKCS